MLFSSFPICPARSLECDRLPLMIEHSVRPGEAANAEQVADIHAQTEVVQNKPVGVFVDLLINPHQCAFGNIF